MTYGMRFEGAKSMKFLITTAVAALLTTGAMANDLFIDQIGNNNEIGQADGSGSFDRVEQTGSNNSMLLTQEGNRNRIGASPFPNARDNVQQVSNNNTMLIDQLGNANVAQNIVQDGGNRNDYNLFQTGNRNVISRGRQSGTANFALISQEGNDNEGDSRQIGDRNELFALQDGNRNEFVVQQGFFGGPSSTRGLVDLVQMNSGQFASINQSGFGNSSFTNQE
jgi:hypothetical protein